MAQVFHIITLTLPGLMQPSIAIAASRVGGLGVLDLEYLENYQNGLDVINKLAAAAKRDVGIKLNGDTPELLHQLLPRLPDSVKTIILTSTHPRNLENSIDLLHKSNRTVLLEATCLEQALAGEKIGIDGVIAKGHEAGGRVADETAFILLQRFLAQVRLPIWVQGGIGLHTAAACAAAGAAGVVLDTQLALTRESPLTEAVGAKVGGMDGSETLCLGGAIGETYRVYFRPGNPGVEELRKIEARLSYDNRPPADVLADWRQAVRQRVGFTSEQEIWLLGQDAALAASLGKRFGSVGGVLQALHEAVRTNCQTAAGLRPLDEDSPLARAHGTRYPILQGPMTRVSDVPDFAARIAEGGALPFLALALMRGPEVEALLTEARQRLGSLPWGVGILGFVPSALRQEQLTVIERHRPPFVLIAGGRPDQSQLLEQQGITTYLHVPSPGLLKLFLQQGAKRFVFEGRECGGHVGPRTSFVLWDQMIDVLLLEALATADDPQSYHIVFAGGIHDALSAAMVAVMAAPLAERGARIGILMGSAYLFTQEAVSTGAILKGFQEQASQCQRTVLLETGPGHATRCVDTPFAVTFGREKSRLSKAGTSAEEIRLILEDLNLGRLRIASKGITRHPDFGRNSEAPKFTRLPKSEQLAQGMYMIGQVAALRQKTCSIESLHREVAVEGSERLRTLADRQWQSPSTRPSEAPADIAIVGMACILPKAADLRSYWENILNKVDAITEVPKDRWDWELYFDEDAKVRDKIYSKWGGFLDDVPFDPMQYGMPPATLRSIEPAQLLTLEVVRAALKDAGYLERPFPRERTAVILGAGGGAADLGLGYGSRAFLPMLEKLPEFRGRSQEIIDRLGDHLPEWTEDSFAGILTNVAAGRVANRFNLGGPNYTVDAACASSLAAVSLAVRELETHGSDMVIVGGVDTMQNPFTFLCFSKTQALSPRGRCRTFDESADGIAISEGIVMIVLKRLADAERDGDRIYAVVKGMGNASDGKDRGLTAPRPEGQARALRRAYEKAGLSPATVGLVEAHGTGTVAGDRAEVQALTQVFSEARASQQSCAIGSVKSMIGHTKCTAGSAGLIKAALALYYKVLPPTLGVQKPNPSARFPETPFFINTESRPWVKGPQDPPRRAGVSAFGFGGTNFHVVLEEYTGELFPSRTGVCRHWPGELFLWQGDSRSSLLEAVEPWVKALAGDAQPALRDLAYTAWCQLEEQAPQLQGQPLRLALLATSLDDLKQKLAQARQTLANPETHRINDPRGLYFSAQPWTPETKLAFLFPGQGSQYPHMLRELAMHFPDVRERFELGNRVLAGKLDRSLSSYIFPPSSFSAEEERAQQQALTQTQIAQPAIGAASLGLFRLLQTLGLQPDVVAGHSYGEYVALTAAGVFGEADLLALSEARGRFIVEGAGAEPGTMAAVDAEASVVATHLDGMKGIYLANANAPRQTVIAGTRAAVEQAVGQLTTQGLNARLIPVACAFHSPLVEPARERLAEFLSGLALAEPRLTVYSNTTAAPYPQAPAAVAAQLAEHLVRPVEFMREIEAMYAAGARIFVEVGPRGILTGLVEQILGDRPKLAITSNQSGRSDLLQLLHLLGQLSAHGVTLNLDRLYQDRAVRRLNLSALEKETARPPLPASVWLVNGARARPLQAAPQRPVPEAHKAPSLAPVHADKINRTVDSLPEPVAVPVAAGQSMSVSVDAGSTSVMASAMPAAFTTPIDIPAVPALAGRESLPSPLSMDGAERTHLSAPLEEGIPQVMAQFNQMMIRFLEMQKSVMLTYLKGVQGPVVVESLPVPSRPNSHVPSVRTIQRQPLSVPEAVSASPTVSETVAAQEVPPAAADRPGPALSRDELTVRLRAVVSERTGYPPEMLDLDLDLEADLGIDSIKRVEILGNLQQALAAAGVGPLDGLLEKLTGVRTLRAIIERVLEHAQAAPAAVPVPVPVPVPAVAPPPVAAETKAGLSADELTVRLQAVVSERTGYPPEMLDLDLDLEADLGIDSIKRVEILGNLQQALAAAGVGPLDGLLEKLTGVRTLRAIIERVLEHSRIQAKPEDSNTIQSEKDESVAGTTATSAPDRNHQEDGRIQRYTLLPTEAPLRKTAKELTRNGVLLLTADGRGIARTLAEALRNQGHKIALVEAGSELGNPAEGHYSADLGSAEAVTQLADLIRRRQGPLGGIIHLLPLQQDTAFAAMDLTAWRQHLQLDIKSLFYLAKAVGEDLRKAQGGRTCLLAATGLGGTFMSAPSAVTDPNPGQGGIAGLVKTLALEWPEVRVKAVDVDPREADSLLAGHLLDELSAGDDRVEVGYCQGRRLTLELQAAAPSQDEASSLGLDASAVILITGGARGITAKAAYRLAERYRPTLLLAGRSPLPEPEEAAETVGLATPKELKAALLEQLHRQGRTVTLPQVESAYARLLAEREVRATLATLRRLGATVHYYQVDVRDGQAFGRLIDDIYTSFGRLDGVIHGAGIIEDKLIQDKTADSFDRVFDTKVDSAFVLSRKLRPDTLKFLVFFASVAGRFGNHGQGDYAAANEVLNKLAARLDREWPGRVVAIDWGPWDTAGMVSPELRKQFAERGVELIPTEVGLRRLEEELNFGRKGESEVIIGGAGWRSPVVETAATSWPLLAGVIPKHINGFRELFLTLDPAHHLYLKDHQIDDQPVLPLAMAMELMAETAAQGWPDLQVVGIRELSILKGIILKNGPRQVRVLLKPQEMVRSEALDVAVEITGTEQPQRVHYRATVELAKGLPASPVFTPLSLLEGRPLSLDMAETYRQWLFHGPLLQGITQVDQIGTDGVKSVLRPSSPQSWLAHAPQKPWLIDPLLFDSGLQLLILWTREHWDMTTLPSRFRSYRRFGNPTGQHIGCELRIRPESGGHAVHGNIVFLDTDGRVLGMLEDIECTCSAALNRLSARKSQTATGEPS